MKAREKIIYIIYGKFGCVPRLDSSANVLVQTAILAQHEGIDIESILDFTEKYKIKRRKGKYIKL